MRYGFKLTAALLATILVAQPAYADRIVYHSGGHYDRHHHKRGHAYGHAKKRVVVVRRPAYVNRTYITNRYYTPYYTPAPVSYSEIRCTNEVNPLGLLLGGTAGGIVGHQIGKGRGNTAATIGGAVIGSVIGGSLAQQRCSEQVFYDTPIGTPVSWQGNNEYYAVTPTREYRTAGRYCREYQARATVGGRIQDTYGTACMQPDGSWEIVN